MLTKSEMNTLHRLLVKSTDMPKVPNIGELAREHLEAAIKCMADITKLCPTADLRLKAAQSIVELSKLAEVSDDYTGDSETLIALTNLPQGERRTAALQMFANGQIGRKDLDTVLKALDSDQSQQISLLLARSQHLEKIVEQQESRIINGTANGRQIGYQ